MNFGHPWCETCNKPVDRVTVEPYMFKDVYMFRIFCHGKSEKQALTRFEIEDAIDIKFGVAFRRDKLCHPSKRP